MFKVGKVYKRKEEIHDVYGGQRQGGISTPTSKPMILIFTSEAGDRYGYQDKFQPDGTFWYTGEGQVGDMEMLRGNAALLTHLENGKKLHLFEYVKKAYVRYIGEALYAGHHTESRPDREGGFRKAIIFHLALIPEGSNQVREDKAEYVATKNVSLNCTLAELRDLALQASVDQPSKQKVVQDTATRAKAIRLYALKRSAGSCEGCAKPAPFYGKDGPFLEMHHLLRLADGGPDDPLNVIALCPNCHRRVHLGLDGQKYNLSLVEVVQQIERELVGSLPK